MKKLLSLSLVILLLAATIPPTVTNAACTLGTTDLLEFGDYLIEAGSASNWYDTVLVDNGETGTEDDPIIIDSAEEFVCLTKGVLTDTAGKYYKVADGITNFDLSRGNLNFNGTLEENLASITGSGKNHAGTSPGFQGNFDGNGVTVYGAWSNHNEGNIAQYAGLFSITRGDVTIKNINVKLSHFTAKNAAGGIVGYHIGDGTNTLTIENCSVTDTFLEVKESGWGCGIGGIIGFSQNLDSFVDTDDTDGDDNTTETIYINGPTIIKNCFVNLDEEYFISEFEQGSQTNTTIRGVHGGVAGYVGSNALSVSDCIVIGITPYATTSCTSYNDVQHSGLPSHFTNVYTDQQAGNAVLIGGRDYVATPKDFTGHVTQLTSTQLKGATAIENMDLDWNIWATDINGYPRLRTAQHYISYVANADGTHSEVCDCGIIGASNPHAIGEPSKENIIEPTCVSVGSYDLVRYCTVCHYELSRETIVLDATDHIFDDDDLDTDCNVCGEARTSIMYGDVNGDNKINTKDYVLFVRYINGWNIDIIYEACDTNRDGNINSKDLALLMQYINGWDVCIHKYIAATCTSPKMCVHCGQTFGNALGHNYVAGECNRINHGELCGNFKNDYCPKLYFTGDMSQITREDQTSKKIECDIDVQYRSQEQIVNRSAKIKIQGTSSTQWRKKNYTITLYEEGNFDQKQGIDVGWGQQSKYCLKANWIDKTHSRNVVTAKLVGEMQKKYNLFPTAPNGGAVDGFPVEVYINGEFHGLYTMNIPKDEWQFDMDGDNPNHIVICGENWNDPVLFKDDPNLTDWSVEVGPENDETLAKIKRLSDFIRFSSDAEFKANINQYLNLDATLNYYVMMDYAYMMDNRGKNMLLATYDGNVWYPSLYDLDTTWGTNWRGDGLYSYQSGLGGSIRTSLLWSRIEDNFSKELATRYFELRYNILEPDYVMSKFHEFYNSIPQEILDREVEEWTRPGDPIPGYDLSQIQTFLDTLIPRLDVKYSNWL